MDKSGYTYGPHGTPTFTLEARLATLEGGKHVILAPSGLSALTVVNMALLKAGDAVLLPDNVYYPSRDFAQHEMAGWGVSHRLYDPLDPRLLRAQLQPDVKLVWLRRQARSRWSSRPAGPHRHRALLCCCAAGRDRARQHLGCGLAFAPFELA